MLKACLNGARLPAEHPNLPVTPEQIARAAAQAVDAGAQVLHVHCKGPDGTDSLRPEVVDPVVEAVRAAVPGVPFGVTTGAWAESDPAARVAAVRGWRALPDFASVNWHEPGAADVADALLDRGLGVEAGVWHADAARTLLDSGRLDRHLRVLVEPMDPDPARALATAAEVIDLLAGAGVPLLLHGMNDNAWPVLVEAVRRGLDTRIGMEDTLTLPDGELAKDNADLVRAAVSLGAR